MEKVRNRFSEKTIYKYTLSGSSLTLKECYVFNGTLPSRKNFRYESCIEGENYQSIRIYLYDDYFSLSQSTYSEENSEYVDGDAELTFSNGSFSGEVYDDYDSSSKTRLGNVMATYSVNGSGDSASITLTFTQLPDVFSLIEKNKPYTLSQESEDDYEGETYTLK